MTDNLLLSILVNSNNVENFKKLIDSYEENAKDPYCFEVIVNIDEGDLQMINYVESEKNKRPFNLHYIKTTGGYFSGHLHNNLMLEVASKNSYFVVCLGDRMQICTKEWDYLLRGYVKYFKDDLFRVTCSKYKYRNYVDFWECCFAPSNIAFTTRKWLDITKNWGPCFSGDAFQQCISYYLTNHDNFNANQEKRDVPDNSLKFEGQKPEEKNLIEERKRIHGQLIAWPILTSSKVQMNAKKLAMQLLANIINNQTDNKYIISQKKSYIILSDSSKLEKVRLNFSVNYFKILVTNFYRKFLYLNYAGSGFGRDSFKKSFCFVWYLDYRYKFFTGIKDFYCKYFQAKRS